MKAQNKMDAEVIVVGAGPSGSAVAALLAREGVRILLLDKAVAPPPKVCGEYLSPGCLPILDRLGALKSIRDAGARPLYGMLIHSPRGRTLRAPYPERPNVEETPFHALSVRRTVLDPLLLDLAAKNGAIFESGFQASGVLWQDGRVAGIEGRLQGRLATRCAPLVVGADGRHSVIARGIGAVQRHPWLDRIAIVTYLTGVRREEAVGEIFLGRDRYAILNPIAPDLTNLGLVINRRDLPRGEDPRHAVRRIAASLPGLADRLVAAKAVAPVRCLGPLAHRALRLTSPGALLVGDAAGFLDPFTGEGIYAALRTAELAVESILAARERLEASPEMNAYAGAWVREFLPKWRFATWLQRAIRRPWLAEGLVAWLARRPDLASFLMAAAGDLVPSKHLALPRLLTRLAGVSA